MAAAADDLFIKVGYGTATTLSAPGYSAGVSASINVGSTSTWPTTTGVIFAIDEAEIVDGEEVRVDGTYNVFEGAVTSGTQISSVDYIGGDPERSYSAGALTRVYMLPASYLWNRLIDGLVAGHRQLDGAHTFSQVLDANGNETLKLGSVASAVNEVTITNAAAGNGPTISATGSDTNISVDVSPKGSGQVLKSGNPIDTREELNAQVLTVAGDTMTVSFTAKKLMRIFVFGIDTGGTINGNMTFNGDASTNYAVRVSDNGSADVTAASAASTTLDIGGASATPFFAEITIVNISAQEKLITGHITRRNTLGSGNVPTRREFVSKWVNTSAQITSITVTNTGTGSYDVGSFIKVEGSDV